MLWRTCWGTHWELERNIVRTNWEPGTNFLKSLKEKPWGGEGFFKKGKKGKKQGTLSVCLGLSIGCMKFLVPKEFITIALLKNTLCIEWQYKFSCVW